MVQSHLPAEGIAPPRTVAFRDGPPYPVPKNRALYPAPLPD
ncbi:hypothetical protein C8R32_10590 [Nitrosospira sp. Nsp5]|uniref:Uncharacterized protein n=1 Tax=Nitrosospira multiformis TaxID=1231 RepID=A0ABY0TAT7_9PROT|nr:hypothetical protein C8R32_10590 [Nitrosospira sp. Nsp5]SDQ55070.1 hypothetical protein SAMN05216402_1281 [Nitrosospira multiformis]